MRRIIIVIAIFLGMAAQAMPPVFAQPLSQETERNVLVTAGEIKAIGNNKVTIAGKGAFDEVILHIQPGTYILDGIGGRQIPFTDLKQGATITAYYGPRLTKSIPPQGAALALLTGASATGSGKYLQVAKVEAGKDGSIRVLCTNREQLITIRPDVFARIADIKAGSELIVWYDFMTLSLPGQATATKVALLSAKPDIRVHTGAGVIVINGQEVALGNDDIIKTDENTLMLPLRVIAESLGYRVVWSDEKKTVELQNAERTMTTMTIGSKLYGKLKMTVELACPPEIVNGKTLVPVEFFTDVMQLNVEINNSHI